MPNQFLSDEFGDIEDYFVTDYWLIDQFVGDQLWVWGLNSSGQSGINSTVQSNTPVTTFAGGTTWKQVSAWSGFSAAIKTDGSLWTWGTKSGGQLGDNTNISRSTPVTTFAGGTDWKQVACGSDSAAAIKTDGSLWTWGRGTSGQLGNNTNTDRSTPVTTFAGGNNWKQVAIGYRFVGAVKTDGTLWMWGANYAPNLGINNTTSRNVPVTTFAGGTDWKQVACGEYHTVAVKTNGTLWTWGDNASGELGINVNGSDRRNPVTTFAGGTTWKQVTAKGGSGRGRASAAIKTDGTLWTWGDSSQGTLGTNDYTPNRSTPVTTFAGGTNWKQVSLYSHASAIKTDGTLWVWGRNDNGGLGINGGGVIVPVTTFAGGTNWKLVSAGNLHTSAITSGLNVDLS